MEARGRWLRGLNQAVFGCLCLCMGGVVVVMALPERKRTEEVEKALLESQERERDALARREQHMMEWDALKRDKEYLELRARDRLDLCREGERVLRIER